MLKIWHTTSCYIVVLNHVVLNASAITKLNISQHFNLNVSLSAIIIISLSTNKKFNLNINVSINEFVFHAASKDGFASRQSVGNGDGAWGSANGSCGSNTGSSCCGFTEETP